MRNPLILIPALTFLLVTLQSAAAAPTLTAAEQKALTPMFTAAEKGIRDQNEPLFRAQFHPDGYARNLVGGSGLAGSKTYRQGTRKSWYLRPRWAEAQSTGGDTALVPCDVFRWTDGKIVDGVDAAVVKHQGRWVVLGGGERRAEVEALLERWKRRQPLDPPARP